MLLIKNHDFRVSFKKGSRRRRRSVSGTRKQATEDMTTTSLQN